jgi:hypothetical protein
VIAAVMHLHQGLGTHDDLLCNDKYGSTGKGFKTPTGREVNKARGFRKPAVWHRMDEGMS